MIYTFSWNSQYLLGQQISAWKDKFIKTYGDFNFFEISDIWDFEKYFYEQKITAPSFLWEKSLNILHIHFDVLNEKKWAILEYIISLLPKVDENNILLFVIYNPDKRKKIYKDLIKLSQLKEFNINEEQQIFQIIEKKYPNLDPWAAQLIVKYKAGNLDKITSELDKLSILKEHISRQDIKDHIIPELEESIFELINTLISWNKLQTISYIDTILEQTNIYALYHSLLANLRPYIYICILKSQWKSQSEIQSILDLWKRWFLVGKIQPSDKKRLDNIYNKLISLDARLKSWKLLDGSDKSFKHQIQTIILSS